jgi:hypothetical protein
MRGSAHKGGRRLGGPSILSQRVPSKANDQASHQRRHTNRISRVLSGIIKFHFRSHSLMDIAQLASLRHQLVQSSNPLLENRRNGQRFPRQDLTPDIIPKLNISGFRLKIRSVLKLCKEIPSPVLIYGLRTLAMMSRTHMLAQL